MTRLARAGLRAIPGLAAIAALAILPPPAGLAAQAAPDSAALAALAAGERIRATGPAIREAVPLRIGDVLRGGITALLIRPPAQGTVVEATSSSLRFVELRRSEIIDAPWARLSSVDLYQGRSPALGLGQGLLAGALGGLVLWGTIEFIFLWADNPVVEDPELLIGISSGAGALFGAAAFGHQWEPVFP